MDSNNRWQYNPYNKNQPLRPVIQRKGSAEQLQPTINPSRNRPSNDRVCKDVPYPIVHKLRIDELFDFRHGELPNIDLLAHHLKNEGRLAEPTWRHLFSQAKSIFRQEANLISLPRGCTIVGDIHGQFYDLLTIFESGGRLGEQPYVFLGDYVDRGSFSCECLFLLLALKLVHPHSLILLRGNHESRQMTQMFTYKKECRVKYSLDLWYESMTLFDSLPICALIDNRFLCMHGGISPYIKTLDDIMKLNRFQELPSEGPLCDLMWSDPHQQFAEHNTSPWIFNKTRNCSFFFNYKACEQFLIENRLLSIIRAHEVVPNGLLFYNQGSLSKFPVLISVFSAPNYCDVYNNTAAIIVYDYQRNFRPIHFQHRSHPFVLSNHENGFELGHRLMKTYIQEILLILIQGYTKTVDQFTTDNVTKQLKNKEYLLNEHTNKCRRLNQLNIQLGNLTPPEQFQEKALNNKNLFEQEADLLHQSSSQKNLSTTFDAASKIDAIYEERIY